MTMKKKFAIGYQRPQNGEGFSAIVEDYSDTVAEVYFSWPGEPCGRNLVTGDSQLEQDILMDELKTIRNLDVRLDFLWNANCYGAKAAGVEFEKKILGVLRNMERCGILPEIVTTTSPFVAHVVKKMYPLIEMRASVNMRIDSTLAMEYLGDSFDSFYIRRDLQRDRKILSGFHEWCILHGKKLCLLANSGCLRNCPYQSFHDNLVAHLPEMDTVRNVSGFQPHLCWNIYRDPKMYVNFLRSSWLRPEDLPLYAPYVSVIKLATRVHSHPRMVIDAYTSGTFDGNLLRLMEPNFSTLFSPCIIDNKSFPDSWTTESIACGCAVNCRHCGKCEAILDTVLKQEKKQNEF